MASFNVIISPKALSQLNSYIDYLQYTLLNDQAACNVWQDALETQEYLSKAASSLKFCTHPKLKKNGYRIILQGLDQFTLQYLLNPHIICVLAS